MPIEAAGSLRSCTLLLYVTCAPVVVHALFVNQCNLALLHMWQMATSSTQKRCAACGRVNDTTNT